MTIVIIPLGIPGLGKSTLTKDLILKCKSLNIKTSCIESDEVRAQIMAKIKSTN